MSACRGWGVSHLSRILAALTRTTDYFLNLDKRRADWVFAWILLLLYVFKVLTIHLSPLTLAPDEAHYWEWSRQLDWAYYSKGPLIALFIRGGTILFGDTVMGVRFGALLISLLFSLFLYMFMRKISSAPIALLIFVLLHTGAFFQSLGLAMTTDAPVLLFWLLGVSAVVHVFRKEKDHYWLFAGLCFGLAILSKYTALLAWPSVFLVLLSTKHLRRHLINPYFWGGVFLTGLSLIPVLLFNVKHEWVNFAHNAGHLVSHKHSGLQLKYFPELLGSQFALVGPILFPLFCWALWRGWKHYRNETDVLAGSLVFGAFPLLGLCFLVSFGKRVYANWPMPAYVYLAPLLAYLFHKRVLIIAKLRAWLGASLLLSIILLIPGYAVIFGVDFGVPAHKIPTKKLLGWDRLGGEVDRLLSEVEQQDGEIPFVINNRYDSASAIAFYAKKGPRVFCAKLGDRRMNQYDIWGGWEEQKGRNALMVLRSEEAPPELERHFVSVEEIGEPLMIDNFGEELRTFYFFLGRNYDGSRPEVPGRY